MRTLTATVLLSCCSACITLDGARLHASPVKSVADLPMLPVELSEQVPVNALCASQVTVAAWRAAVKRSLAALGTPAAWGRPGIRLEVMSPVCARNDETEVRYRARLFGSAGEELAATNGIARGTPFAARDLDEGALRSLSVALELATQQAIVPLLEQSRALSLSTTR